MVFAHTEYFYGSEKNTKLKIKKFYRMIARIWHGCTTKENEQPYEELLKHEIFKGIAEKNIKGYKGIKLLKRAIENDIEYTTIMFFDDIEAIKMFMGEDYETAYVLPKAKNLLKTYDKKSIHCEVLCELHY